MNRKKMCAGIILPLMFIYVFMFILNMLTRLCVDDFTYMFSFSTRELIESVGGIFSSIYRHYFAMNGRSIAHFLAQFFLYIPTFVFKILNPGVFVLQIWLMYKMAKTKVKDNPIILLLIFALLFIFEPAFGQVSLWLTGSCNYLWAVTCCLGYTYFYVKLFTEGEGKRNPWFIIGLLILGFIAGGFQENAAVAAVGMNVLILLAHRIIYKKKIPWYYAVSIILACASFLLVLASPAQITNKVAEGGFSYYYDNLMGCKELYEKFGILIVMYFIQFVVAEREKVEEKRLILSVIFFAASLAGTFAMIVASYRPERCLVMTASALVMANGVLMFPLAKVYKKYTKILFLGIVWVSLGINMAAACMDVYDTYKRIGANEEIIYQCKDTGDGCAELEMIYPKTKYSSIYDLKYLDCNDPYSWPNGSMSRYYGVGEIIGKIK